MSTLRIESCIDPSVISKLLACLLPLDQIDVPLLTRQILLDTNFREAGSFVGYRDDEPVAYCWAVKRQVPLENAPDDSDRGYIVTFGTKPEAWSGELANALLETAESYLKSAGCTSCWISPYAPGYFTPGLEDAKTVEFLLRVGYEVSSRPLAMQLDLTTLQVPAHVKEGPGVEIRTYEPGLTIPLLRFAEETFQGDWVRFARDAARDILRGDNPGRLQIAIVDGRVVGFAHYQGGRFGPIGVARELDGTGIGSMLMLRTLEAMRTNGTERAWFMWTDDRTAARFYAPWGWKEWRRFSVLMKPL